MLSFADATALAPEGGVARLALELSRPSERAAVVGWVPEADADADDHGAPLEGAATFAAGGTEAFIEVPVLDDGEIEPAREFLRVRLLPPASEADWALGLATALVAVQEGVFATAAERRSRFFAAAYAGRRTKDAVGAALRRCRSITFDNGLEFAGHLEVGSALGAEMFFADPYSSWQRGTNEWLNGRLRRYFPKGMPLTSVTDGEIQSALDKINSKPMKVLGWRTPHEACYGVSQKLTRICT